MAKTKQIIAISAPVTIEAASADGHGKLPAKFTSTFYTGGALRLDGWDMPVVVDLAGLTTSKVLVANLDHDRTKRVGNFAVANDGKSLVANGSASAATAARDEVINSAADGYEWQASLEAVPSTMEHVRAGQKAKANGQTFEGPMYIARKSTLKGFAFVSHGADENTSATIAAAAASTVRTAMKAEIKAWAESMGIDVDNATPEMLATIEANYEGRNYKPKPIDASSDPFKNRKLEARRRTELRDIADKFIDRRQDDIEYVEAIEKMHDHAIEAKMSASEFRTELYESLVPISAGIPAPRNRDRGLTNRVLMAAVCETGKLSDVEKQFTDQELQAAHDRFPHGISLGQLFIMAAEANGYRGSSGGQVTLDVQRAAFGMTGPQSRIHASGGGFSTIDIASVVAATANKFLHEGWMFVDQTPMRLARIKPVRNFHQHTTVSLTGALQFEQLGAAGEIKHGTLGDLTYTNQADTYAAMLAITRKDIINDDLSALTAVPRRLGRGGALKLNDIFWTEFLGLVGASFFASGNTNINTGVATMTLAGLAATETIFMNQTDPDGKPVGFTPRIIVVPPALKADAIALTDAQSMIVSGNSAGQSNVNPFRGRFRVESSPYISNSSYTGYTSVGWWLLADPNDEAVIEIAALNGRVEPTVDTADASFNVLGVQMRGYCDIGVADQEYRAGVYADGGGS
jgi:hypothetical protein